jgi:hypothetical protein
LWDHDDGLEGRQRFGETLGDPHLIGDCHATHLDVAGRQLHQRAVQVNDEGVRSTRALRHPDGDAPRLTIDQNRAFVQTWLRESCTQVHVGNVRTGVDLTRRRGLFGDAPDANRCSNQNRASHSVLQTTRRN